MASKKKTAADEAAGSSITLQLGLVTVRAGGEIVADSSSAGQFFTDDPANPPKNAIGFGNKIRVDAALIGDDTEKAHLREDGSPGIVWHYNYSDGLYTGSFTDDPAEEQEGPLVEHHLHGGQRTNDSPVELIPQGLKQFYASNGLTTIFRVDKAREDNDRHTLALWFTIDGVEDNDGNPKESNKLVFTID